MEWLNNNEIEIEEENNKKIDNNNNGNDVDDEDENYTNEEYIKNVMGMNNNANINMNIISNL